MSEQLLSTLQNKFPEIQTRASSDFPAFNISAKDLPAVAKFVRDELKYDLLSDISGVDWDDEEPRFSVVYNLTSTVHHKYRSEERRVGKECRVRGWGYSSTERRNNTRGKDGVYKDARV